MQALCLLFILVLTPTTTTKLSLPSHLTKMFSPNLPTVHRAMPHTDIPRHHRATHRKYHDQYSQLKPKHQHIRTSLPTLPTNHQHSITKLKQRHSRILQQYSPKSKLSPMRHYRHTPTPTTPFTTTTLPLPSYPTEIYIRTEDFTGGFLPSSFGMVNRGAGGSGEVKITKEMAASYSHTLLLS